MLPRNGEPLSPEVDPESTGHKIGFLIETNHLTVPNLAQAISVSASALQEVVDGQALASEVLVKKICEHLKVHESFFAHDGQQAAASPSPSERRPSSDGKDDSPSSSTEWDPLFHTLEGFSSADSSSSGVLTLKALAARHQALVELLVLKGVISGTDYRESIYRVEQRNLSVAIQKEATNGGG